MAAPAWPKDGLAASLIDALPFMVLVLDSRRRIAHANASVLRFLSHARLDEVLGLLPGDAFGCARPGASGKPCGESDPCRLCGARQAITACLVGRADTRDCRITLRQGKLHRTLDLKVWASPLSHGGQDYIVLSLMDVSREHRARMLERIFFHDVANTLAGLKGLVGLMADDKDRIEPRDLEILRDSVEQLSEEILSQRDLAAAERGDLLVRPAQISSLDLLRGLRESFSRRSTARGKAIDIDPMTRDVTFESDPTLLKRVLGNMVLNALEASTEGQAVVLGCDAGTLGPVFWVRNQSPMPSEVAAQIFQHSFSTKGQGRGLGTYSLKLLGEGYLGGRVSFETGPGIGTIFRLALPTRPIPKENPS